MENPAIGAAASRSCVIGARQWIGAGHISDPVCSLAMGLPDDLVFRAKGELAIDICAEAFADSAVFDFVCGDEVYGACTKLREFLEGRGQAYVLRVSCSFPLTLAHGVTLTCAEVATVLLNDTRRWEAAPRARVPRASAGMRGPWWPLPAPGIIC